MPDPKLIDLPPLTDWQVQSLRVTAFPGPAAKMTQPTWWSDLIGELPETKVSEPKSGVYQEEGPFGNGRLVLRIQPNRIDWTFSPAPRELPEEKFSVIGLFIENLEAFSQIMYRWFDLETCPSVMRLAFAAVLLQPVDDRQAGYRRLSAYLSYVEIDAEGSSDFSYQINRPRKFESGSISIKINRLSKWIVSLWQPVRLFMSPTHASISSGQEKFACLLALDINTAADFQGEFSREQQRPILEELISLAKEIAEKGDKP